MKIGTIQKLAAAAAMTMGLCSGASAAVIAINGGGDWTGWMNRGSSADPAIYARNAKTPAYNVYTTVFRFDNHAPAAGTSGSNFLSSRGSFANGHTILGIGVAGLGTTPTGNITARFDLDNDNFKTPASNGGLAVAGSSALEAGEFTTTFSTGLNAAPLELTLCVRAGNCPNSGSGYISTTTVNGDFAFRILTRGDSYQLFFDLDSMQSLYGPSPTYQGINAFQSLVTVSLRGLGEASMNDVVLSASTIAPASANAVPEPSALMLALAGLGMIGGVRRRARRNTAPAQA